MTILRSLLPISFFGLCGLAAVAKATCTLSAVAVLPIRIEHGRSVVPADINGKPAELLVGTGYFATSLTASGAGRLGVSMAQTDRDVYGVGGTRHNFIGRVDRMRLGGLNADGLTVGGTGLASRSEPPGVVDGVLGMNLMAAYDIDLDIAGSHLILYEANGTCSRPTVALQPDLYSVKLDPIRHDRQAVIDVDIDGQVFKASLDSGAAHSMMYRAAARRLGIDLSPMRAIGHAVHHGLGPVAVAMQSHVFKIVKIGDLQVNNMPVDILDQEDNGIDRVRVGSRLSDAVYDQANGEQILIGADFMQRFHLWISHSSQMLIMQYPPQPSILPH